MRVATNAARGPVAPTPTPCPNRVGSTRTPHRCWTRKSGLDKVMKPFPVQSGTVAPAYGQLGLGTQYLAPVRLEVLLRRGILREVQ